MAEIAADSLVIYTVTDAQVANNGDAGVPIQFADATGDPAAPFFAVGSRIIGRTVGAAVGAAGARTYTVQFGPVVNVPAAAPGLQVLAIPETHLKKITMLNDVTVGQGGSRKKRQSKKKKNQRRHNNNQ